MRASTVLDSFEHEIERGDDIILLEVEITDTGYPARMTGHPDTWEPGEGPTWRVAEAHLYDHNADDLGRVVECPELTNEEREAIDAHAARRLE